MAKKKQIRNVLCFLVMIVILMSVMPVSVFAVQESSSSETVSAQGDQGDCSSVVKFKGTATTDENNVGFICYGSYYCKVKVEELLSNPGNKLKSKNEYTICYGDSSKSIKTGDKLEVYGEYYHTGGPLQWVGHIIAYNDGYYIKKIEKKKPDLIIKDISWSPSSPDKGDTIKFTVKIKNQGSGSAGSSTVKYYIDGSYVGSDSVSKLSAGSTSTETFTWTASKCGNVKVKAVADANNDVYESSGKNNDRTETVSIKCPTLKPDLIIKDISWSPSSPEQGDTIKFTVKIKNQGSGSAGSSTVKYYIDGSYVGSDSVSKLSAGSTSTETFTWTASKCGDVKVKAVADANNDVYECGGKNNDRTETVSIKCPTVKPDLIITDISWSPSNPDDGGTIAFTVTIKNQGSGSAGSSIVKYYVDGSYVEYDSVPALSVGSTSTQTFTWTANKCGNVQVKAVADVNNAVSESNEGNNDRTEIINIICGEKPAPEIIKVTYPTTCVKEDEYTTISVTVKNNGGASSEGYLSVSFPNDEHVSGVSGTGNGYNKLYPKGSLIWNSNNQQMGSVDPLVELLETNWQKGQQETITMNVKPNSGSDEIVFYVRAALKNADGTYERDPTYSGDKDQQGWCVERHVIDVCPKEACVIIDDDTCVEYKVYVDDVYQLTEGVGETLDGSCTLYVAEGTHTIEIRDNGCKTSIKRNFEGTYTWNSMPDNWCKGNAAVKFRGVIVKETYPISFYNYKVKIDEILEDPSGVLSPGDEVWVWAHADGPAQVDSVGINDQVEVYGTYDGEPHRAVKLETGEHYLRALKVSVIIDDDTCVGYEVWVDGTYKLTDSDGDGYCSFSVADGTHTIAIRDNGCSASITRNFDGTYTWNSMPDNWCKGDAAVKFKGTIVKDSSTSSFYNYKVKIDDVLTDPSDVLDPGDEIWVWAHADGSAQVDSVSIDDQVEVYGTYDGESHREVKLEMGEHYLRASNDEHMPLLWRSETHDWVHSVDISSDGNYVAAGSSDQYVYLFDKAGTRVWKKPTGGSVSSVSISSDGNYVAAGSSDQYVYLFDKAGTRVWKKPTGGSVSSVCISSDGNYVAAGSSDQYVYLFDKAGTRVWKKPTGGSVSSVCISSDGNYVATGSSDQYAYLFDSAGTRVWKKTTDGFVSSISISSDGNYVVAGAHSVYLFDKVGTQIWEKPSDGWFSSVDISSKGNYIAAGSLPYLSIYYYNKAGDLSWGKDYASSSVSISKEGNYVAAGSGSVVYCFDKNGNQLKYNTDDGVLSVSISSDGNYIAAGAGNYTYLLQLKPKPIEVDDDFEDDPANRKWNTIQEGINNANDGDTVLVYNGTYYENVVVNRSINLTGIGSPVIDANESGSAIEITADSCVIDGFTVVRSKWGYFGIGVESNDNIVRNNVVKNCYGGISVSGILKEISDNKLINNTVLDAGISLGSFNSTLRNNTIDRGFCVMDYFIQNIDTSNTVNGKPIYYLVNEKDRIIGSEINPGYLGIVNSNNITIRDLKLTNSNHEGILLANTMDSRIENVDVSNNWYGIELYGASRIDIERNNVFNNWYGIHLSGGSSAINVVDNNIYSNTYYGVYSYFHSSKNNITKNNIYSNGGFSGPVDSAGIYLLSGYNNIENNTIYSNRGNGILLDGSYRNNIKYNNIYLNEPKVWGGGCGIRLYDYSTKNNVTNNIVSNNSYGICLSGSPLNNLYLNNFINNTKMQVDSYDSTNIWNSTEEITYTYNGNRYTNYLGNYWSNYIDVDANDDGIWDNPRSIDGDKDNYPLVKPYDKLKPDLTITDVSWNPSNPKKDDEVSFYYTIKNQGYEDTTDFTTALYIDGERYSISARESLKAGESKDRFFARTWDATCSDHSIIVVADDLGEIEELNERNNQSTEILNVVCPDDYICLSVIREKLHKDPDSIVNKPVKVHCFVYKKYTFKNDADFYNKFIKLISIIFPGQIDDLIPDIIDWIGKVLTFYIILGDLPGEQENGYPPVFIIASFPDAPPKIEVGSVVKVNGIVKEGGVLKYYLEPKTFEYDSPDSLFIPLPKIYKNLSLVNTKISTMGCLPIDWTPPFQRISNTNRYVSYIECNGTEVFIICPEDEIPDTNGLALVKGTVIKDGAYLLKDPYIFVSSIEIKLKGMGSQVTEMVSAGLECPANLHAYDSQGRHIGVNATGGIDFEISDAYYSGPNSDVEEIIIFNHSKGIKFVVKALDQGVFNLTIKQNTDTALRAIYYQDIPITKTTEAIVDVSEENPTYTMEIDSDGDGKTDRKKKPDSIYAIGQISYSIQLHSGWNLISLPLMPDDTDVLAIMSSVDGNWNSVWSYEGGKWKRYDLAGPDFLNDLTTIEPGKGYWINMRSNNTLSISGSEPAIKSIPLSAGWNLVGYNSLNSMPTTDTLSSVSSNWNSVWSYEDGTWKRYDLTGPSFLNDLSTMEPGKGYWINMKSSDTWSLEA